MSKSTSEVVKTERENCLAAGRSQSQQLIRKKTALQVMKKLSGKDLGCGFENTSNEY